MKWGWVFLGVLFSLGALAWGEMGMEIPEYDGQDRVHDLNAKNYKSVMKKYDVMVIYYHKHPAGKHALKQFEMEELALEVREPNPRWRREGGGRRDVGNGGGGSMKQEGNVKGG